MKPNIMRKDALARPLDDTDRHILTVLAKDVRITNKELAGRVGLSPSACLERVRRLTAEGVIRGAPARIDPAALGIEVEALVAVRLRRHTRSAVEAFRRHVGELREVIETYHVTGPNDFVLHVVARDMDHLRDLTLDGFTRMHEVGHLETSLVFGREEKHALPDLASPADGDGP